MRVCVPGTSRGPERVFDPLERKLQRIVSHYIGAGNPRFLGRAAIPPALNCFKNCVTFVDNCRYALNLRIVSVYS